MTSGGWKKQPPTHAWIQNGRAFGTERRPERDGRIEEMREKRGRRDAGKEDIESDFGQITIYY